MFAPQHRALRVQLDQTRTLLEELASQLAGRRMSVTSAEGTAITTPPKAGDAPGQPAAGPGPDKQADLKQQALADSGRLRLPATSLTFDQALAAGTRHGLTERHLDLIGRDHWYDPSRIRSATGVALDRGALDRFRPEDAVRQLPAAAGRSRHRVAEINQRQLHDGDGLAALTLPERRLVLGCVPESVVLEESLRLKRHRRLLYFFALGPGSRQTVVSSASILIPRALFSGKHWTAASLSAHRAPMTGYLGPTPCPSLCPASTKRHMTRPNGNQGALRFLYESHGFAGYFDPRFGLKIPFA